MKDGFKLAFVYGSLKASGWNNAIMGDSELVGVGVTEGNFLLTNVGFPYMVPENALTGPQEGLGAPVVGEVYLVSPETQKRMDRLEGVSTDPRNSHYNPTTIMVSCNDTIMDVMTYIPADVSRAQTHSVCPQIDLNGQNVYEWTR